MMFKMINVLIACEESQAECLAFREFGFTAYSCDIQPCRTGSHPEWHIMGDVRPLLAGNCMFKTMDGKCHSVGRWTLVIAHPPCTYLCRVSSVQLIKAGTIDQDRLEKMYAARDFFLQCYYADADYVAVENPIPMARAGLPRPTCYTEPYWFGVKYTKKTLWWLRNLPPIMPDVIYPAPKEFVRASRGKYRSRTFPQVARAIAQQWGQYILDNFPNQ